MTKQSRPPGAVAPILLTRPAAQGERFAAELRRTLGADIRIVHAPVMAPRFRVPALPGGRFAAVIFTSETGVAATAAAAFGPRLPSCAWCVGRRTAAAAAAAGFTPLAAATDADALLVAIREAGESGPLLHLKGRDSRGDLAARLTASGCATDEAVVYAQEPVPLTDAARALLAGDAPVILPVFSPRTAALIARAAGQELRAPCLVAALSPAVAEAAAASLSPARIVTAATPDAAGMHAAIAQLARA